MSVRPQFQRAFLTWLDGARARLALQPRVVERDNNHLYLNFDHTTPVIEVEVWRSGNRSNRNEYRIWVRHHIGAGLSMDPYLILAAEVSRFANKYEAGEPYADVREVYASRAEAWRILLFEPFLLWVNEELALASGIADGATLMTWAPLSHSIAEKGTTGLTQHWIWYHWLIRDGEPLEQEGRRIDNIIPLREEGLARRRKRRQPREK